MTTVVRNKMMGDFIDSQLLTVYRRSKNVSDMSLLRGYEQVGSDSNLGQPVWVPFPRSPVPPATKTISLHISVCCSRNKKLENDQQLVFNEEYSGLF